MRVLCTPFDPAGEECIFAIENDGTNVSFGNVGVELDAAVIK